MRAWGLASSWFCVLAWEGTVGRVDADGLGGGISGFGLFLNGKHETEKLPEHGRELEALSKEHAREGGQVQWCACGRGQWGGWAAQMCRVPGELGPRVLETSAPAKALHRACISKSSSLYWKAALTLPR